MPGLDPYQIPHPLPVGTFAVGPVGWLSSDSPDSLGTARFANPHCFTDLDACLTALPAGNAGADRPGTGSDDTPGRSRHVDVATAAAPPLLLLHGDWLAQQGLLESLEEFLLRAREHLAELLPVLLYRELETPLCVRLMRAGLVDALAVPVTAADWERLLVWGARRHDHRRQKNLIRAQAGLTARLLHSQRRRLDREAAQVADELISSQRSLEETNRQLADHMTQLSLLYRFGRELSVARNWDQTLENILANLSNFVGAAGAALILRSAPDGPYAARRTYQWQEPAWDRVILNLQGQIDTEVAESMLAPGVFRVGSGGGAVDGAGRRIIVLPLEHDSLRLGYFLLLMETPAGREAVSRRYLPFLQAVQVVFSEEVASAQMLDRMRDIGSFNARVLETVSSGIWVVDNEGRTIYCNRAGHQLLTGTIIAPDPALETIFTIGRGRRASQGAAGSVRQRTAATRPADGDEARGGSRPGDDRADSPELLRDARLRLDGLQGVLLAQLLARGEEGFHGEGRIVRAGGESVPVRVQTSTMAGPSPAESWLVIVVEDLRESKKLEAARLRADRLEGLVEMSATLAHEIRNPLMGLSAQAELLTDQLNADDRRKRYLDVITSEVERINDTITRMLDFVRPYAPNRDDVSLLDLAADCVDLAGASGRQRKVRVRLHESLREAAAADWRHQVDPGQIKQVLLNLLLNGVDAAPEGGVVELRLARSKGIELSDGVRGTSQLVAGLLVEVTDDGPGVPVSVREKIFRPFFTTKSSGTGLGLSICHKIVSAHGGDISVARRDGRTRFRVVLPCADEVNGVPRRMEAR